MYNLAAFLDHRSAHDPYKIATRQGGVAISNTRQYERINALAAEEHRIHLGIAKNVRRQGTQVGIASCCDKSGAG